MTLHAHAHWLALALLAPYCLADARPTGSYAQSCRAIAVKDDTLSASCQKLNGSYQNTRLNQLSACLNAISREGDIGNIDGNLLCLPDLPKPVPGFRFPEAERTVNQWVYGGQRDAMLAHSWGLWAGLNQWVGEVDGSPVRAFQTWASPSNMLYRMSRGLQASALPLKRPMLELISPNQFRASPHLTVLKADPAAGTAPGPDTRIFVSTAYNPPAANHAIANKLFLQSSLDTLLAQGYTEVPNFPVNAITIKPVYKVISSAYINAQGLYTFPGWPGTPEPAKPFDESSWNACVYVDVRGSGTGGNRIDPGCQGPNASNTFYLNNFIHHRIGAEEAASLSRPNRKISAGDYAILVGMHVTTREAKRWTWQTFWWSANADAPYAPSSAATASARPLAYLDPAARHYAMALAYQMVAPAQPIVGGQNVGTSVIAYNPHLEAGFDGDPSSFIPPRRIKGPQGEVVNRYGVQTNCMTCHGLAAYQPKAQYFDQDGKKINREKPYGTDFYMSLNDPIFDGKLKLDFAWSILGNMVKE